MRGLSARPAGAAGSVTVTLVPPLGWAVNGERAAVRLDEPSAGGEAKAGAARLGREEWREDLLPDLRRNAGALVGELDAAGGAIAIDGDGDGPTPLHGLGAVDQQVVEDDLAMAATPVGGRKKNTTKAAEAPTATTPGPNPPNQAASMIAGKNCRNGTRRVRFIVATAGRYGSRTSFRWRDAVQRRGKEALARRAVPEVPCLAASSWRPI